MIVPADRGAARRAFLELPYALYRDDPAFVPPLRLERRELLSPRRNAFFAHAEVALFVELDGRRVRGRISLQRDELEERHLGARGATFGLFEARERETALGLIEWARRWARERGCRRLRGPFSLSINQEAGLLVDGFDTPPMLLMPHGRAEYPGWLEEAGLRKARDLYAWRLHIEAVPAVLARAARKAEAIPGLRVRPLVLAKLADELIRVRDVFNSAWSSNWGFLPMTDAELAAMARDLRLIADPRIALLAEVRGEPVGIAIALPDLNEAIADLGGRLLPLGWVKLLYRLKLRGLSGVRLALFGVLESWRREHGPGLTTLLLREIHDRARGAGFREAEVSWILEDNRGANTLVRAMGARRVKTYRLYEQELG